jgi:hypothetical protein
MHVFVNAPILYILGIPISVCYCDFELIGLVCLCAHPSKRRGDVRASLVVRVSHR